MEDAESILAQSEHDVASIRPRFHPAAWIAAVSSISLSLILLAATAYQTVTYFEELGSWCGTVQWAASNFVRRTAFAYLTLPGLFLIAALPARRAFVVARLTWLVAGGVCVACCLIVEWLPELLR